MNDPTAEFIPHVRERGVFRAPAPVARRRPRLAPWLLGVGLVSAWICWHYAQPAAPPPAGKDGPRPIPVGVATAVEGTFDITLAALGTVTPIATVAVKSEISGKLVEIGYQEGQMVKAGDFLAEIDPRPYENALHQAQGQLRRDKALLKNAEIDFDRYRRLVKQDSVSRQQLDTQESLVEQDKGLVEIDQAQVDTAQLNLDYCHIVAPVSGRVGLRLVDLGNYVTSGDANGIVVITQLQPITVVFPVAEDHLPTVTTQLQAGKTLTVAAYDRSSRTLLAKGVLTTVDNQVDPTTGTVKFKAQFDNADLALFPNQFINARLLVETLSGATIVPAAAIRYGPKGTFVYTISEDDKVAMRPVTLSAFEGEHAAILSGIEAGARVVVDGADRLREGAKVKASEGR